MIFFFIPFFLPTVIHIVSNESNLLDWGGYLWKLALSWQSKELVRFLFFKKQTHAHKERERGWWGWLVNLAPSISFKRIPYPIHHITKSNVPFLSNNTYLWSQVFFPLITSRFFSGGIFHLSRKKYIYFTWNKLTLKAQFFIDDLDKFFEFSRSDGYYNVNSAQFLRRKNSVRFFNSTEFSNDKGNLYITN